MKNESGKTLDFVIIGAAKSGTTSLYEYLCEHPMIFMPGRKELSYFSNIEQFNQGMDRYYDLWFSEANDGAYLGEASPQYMYYPAVASRIRSAAPEVKIIAILRNPIDRAYAHYRMGLRKGVETGTFSQCIDNLMLRGPDPCDEMYAKDGFSADYLHYGMYAKILRNYYSQFPSSQIRVYFFEELKTNTESIVRELYEWIGVDPDFKPQTIGRVFNGGGTARLPVVSRVLDAGYNIARKIGFLRSIVNALSLQNTVVSYYRWITNELLVKRDTPEGPSVADRKRLHTFYAADVKDLQKLLNRRVPWEEFSDDLDQSIRKCA